MSEVVLLGSSVILSFNYISFLRSFAVNCQPRSRLFPCLGKDPGNEVDKLLKEYEVAVAKSLPQVLNIFLLQE